MGGPEMAPQPPPTLVAPRHKPSRLDFPTLGVPGGAVAPLDNRHPSITGTPR